MSPIAGDGEKEVRVAIIGGGPAGLMAADALSDGARRHGLALAITVYDRMPSLARKFLMAGRGGLNITHSENLEALLGRYREARAKLEPAIRALPPDAVRAWCDRFGEPTFIGSSGRVFPKSMKASPLLRAWLSELSGRGVEVRLRHRWQGWTDAGRLVFHTPDGPVDVAADAVVLALGGASWGRLGSDGRWVGTLHEAGLDVAPLEPANCGFLVDWSDHFVSRYAGVPLKRIALSFGETVVRGEAMITRTGIEGGAIYQLSSELRAAIQAAGTAEVTVDLRPDIGLDDLAGQLSGPRGKQSLANILRKVARLSPVGIGLVNEAVFRSGRRPGDLSGPGLAQAIKAVRLRLTGLAPIDRAISSAGGLRFTEVDSQFMLTARPGVFVAGEMLDWEAPTGGYLLQACLATGAAAGRGALTYLLEQAQEAGSVGRLSRGEPSA